MSMKPSLAQRLRSRSFVYLLHAALWLLVVLTLTGLGGRTSQFSEVRARSAVPQTVVPMARFGKLFAKAAWATLPVAANALDPFFTRHFNPIHPPSPPPTTRDIDLTYLGYLQAENGPKKTLVKLGDTLLEAPVGANLTANLFAVDAEIDSLTLTNTSGQTNLLRLNAKTTLKVPIP